MDERAQGALLLAVAGVAVRLGLSGSALDYIKPSYVPLLVASGVVIGVLGALVLARAIRALDDPHDHDEASDHGHGHDHSSAPRIAWMLAAPLFAVLLVAPPPLGAFAANRQSGVVQQRSAVWPPLPDAVDGVVPLSLGEYAGRALYDPDLSLAGADVQLTGFVSDVLPDGFVLTRFALSCCAADGTAIDVHVRSDQPAPPVDTWVQVTGQWENRDGHVVGELTTDPPLLEAQSLLPVAQPEEPYET